MKHLKGRVDKVIVFIDDIYNVYLRLLGHLTDKYLRTNVDQMPIPNLGTPVVLSRPRIV
jgi:hypothetical protein